jgi:hypothetical protein
MPADTLEKVYNYFQIKPITLDLFDQYYVNADRGRGKDPIKAFRRRIVGNPDGCLKLLFSGHRGCGKSTELIRLQKDLEEREDFIVLNFSILHELDIVNINYIELFIVTMEKLFDFVKNEQRVAIEQAYLDNIKEWMQSVEIKEINQSYIGADLEGNIKTGINIPFLAEFFARFRASAKSSASMEKTLVTRVEPRISELISLCNQLINQIKKRLPNVNKKGLVIIMEDMDKMDLEKGENIFFLHSSQLSQLNCHCIFTFPIPLLYNIKLKAIVSNYNGDFVLPMIKVAEKDGQDCAEGIAVVRDIVGQRMDLKLFENEDILRKMIRMSGGYLWDLFHMVIAAADSALDFERTVIREEDYVSAFRSLKAEYERTIAENKDRGITVDDYFKELCACMNNVSKKINFTDIMLDLVNNQTILNYNGENWHDVHPVVKEILTERGLCQ